MTDPMTEEDADQLRAWVEQMSGAQVRLLWRWITLYFFTKALAHGGRLWGGDPCNSPRA